jgi:UTP--glucose-1-phosphate uridylyltransferase
MALKREDLREPFMKYLVELSDKEGWRKSTDKGYAKVAATKVGKL